MKFIVVASTSMIIYSFLMETVKSEELEVSTRIVGGSNAAAAQCPYQVSLRENGSHVCGGSIISKSFIVTAAHCVTEERKRRGHRSLIRTRREARRNRNKSRSWKVSNGHRKNRDKSSTPWFTINPASRYSIRAGSLNRNSGGVLVNVASVIPHPNYRNFVNDLALLKLATQLSFNELISPIPLATTELAAGSAVVISGWGDEKDGGSLSSNLKYNTLYVVSNEECRRRIDGISSGILCLVSSKGNGICQGDSGGPAAQNGYLVGVVSYMVGFCGSSIPDGFTKVSYFYNWLKENSDL